MPTSALRGGLSSPVTVASSPYKMKAGSYFSITSGGVAASSLFVFAVFSPSACSFAADAFPSLSAAYLMTIPNWVP